MSWWELLADQTVKIAIGEVVRPAVRFSIGMVGYGLKSLEEQFMDKRGGTAPGRGQRDRASASKVLAAEVNDPLEKQRALAQVVEDMKANPLPADAERFTREALHDRR